jgi:hypothetical protein
MPPTKGEPVGYLALGGRSEGGFWPGGSETARQRN